MDYVEFFEVFKCQLQEKKQKCGFCKKCFNCMRFRQLCYEWHDIVCNSNRRYGICCTAVRFCQQIVCKK